MKIYYKLFHTHFECELFINLNKLVDKVVSINMYLQSHKNLVITVWYKNEMEII